MAVKPDYVTLEIASYLSTWLTIHSGDPATEVQIDQTRATEIASQIIYTLSAYVVSFSGHRLHPDTAAAGLDKVGIKPMVADGTTAHHAESLTCVGTYYGLHMCFPGGGEKLK